MIDPVINPVIEWWSEDTAALIGAIGGTAAGVIGGGIGALVGVCAPRGKLQGPVIATHTLALAASALLLAVGIIANVLKQPYHVFYPLMLSGSLGVGVLGGLLPVTLFAYRAAAARASTDAADPARDPNLAVPNPAMVRTILDSWGPDGSLRRLSLRLAWVMLAITVFAGVNALTLLATSASFRSWFPWAMVVLGPGIGGVLCWMMPRTLLAAANNARALLDRQRLAAEELRRG